MGKDPAVLFYTSDFLTGIMMMTDEEVGKYIRLLCLQHQIYPEHIPENHMLNICNSYDLSVVKKFVRDGNGCYYNERMEEEIEKRLSYCNSRSSNRSKGKKEKTYVPTYEKHMSIHI